MTRPSIILYGIMPYTPERADRGVLRYDACDVSL